MVEPVRSASGCRDYRFARQALNHSSFQAFCLRRSKPKVLLTGRHIGPPQPTFVFKQNPWEEFFIFIIYQNYTLALTLNDNMYEPNSVDQWQESQK